MIPTWEGILGKGLNADQFTEYVGQLSPDSFAWVKFVVVHNTYKPTFAQWHDVSGASRMRGLEGYYGNPPPPAPPPNGLGWHAGPHLFVSDDLIWLFSPLTKPGVHSPSWNAESWGVETTGDWSTEQVPSALMTNLVSALAALHDAAKLDPATLMFHHEDPKTSHHDCPGSNLVKADLITAVQAKLSPLVC